MHTHTLNFHVRKSIHTKHIYHDHASKILIHNQKSKIEIKKIVSHTNNNKTYRNEVNQKVKDLNIENFKSL